MTYSELDWQIIFRRKYGKPPSFLEMEQFKKYYAGNVYLTTPEHDHIIATHRSRSWKEQSAAEKVRDGLLPPGADVALSPEDAED